MARLKILHIKLRWFQFYENDHNAISSRVLLGAEPRELCLAGLQGNRQL